MERLSFDEKEKLFYKKLERRFLVASFAKEEQR